MPSAAPARMDAAERAAVDTAIREVAEGEQWILGPAVERFESELASYLDFGEAVGVANGTDALTIALCALDLPLGSSVLVAANEGGYAAIASRLAGLVPVVMDVDEKTMVPSAATATAAATADVSAIVVTHLHGEAADITALDAWRRERGIALVEDCAQSIGARLAGEHVASRSDAAAFSFYPTKNLATLGDAGAVVFASTEHARRAKALREYGWGERFTVQLPRGRNSRMDAIHAAVLSARLPFLDARNDARRRISNRYRDAFAGRSARVHGDRDTTVAHHCVVVTDHRKHLAEHLGSAGIATAVHYPTLVTEMAGLQLPSSVAVPVAGSLRHRILSLPCFPEMTEDEISHVVSAIEEWDEPAD